MLFLTFEKIDSQPQLKLNQFKGCSVMCLNICFTVASHYQDMQVRCHVKKRRIAFLMKLSDAQELNHLVNSESASSPALDFPAALKSMPTWFGMAC